jgi:type IV pilus assembly protein PilF
MAISRAALNNPSYQSPVKALTNAGNCSLKTEEYRRGRALPARRAALRPRPAGHPGGLARVYFERRDYTRAGFFINRLTEQRSSTSLSADVLWLAIRVKRMLGDRTMEASLAAQLRKRFPGSPEYAAFERGAF